MYMYLILTGEEIFNSAREAEKEYGLKMSLASVVQNDMLITSENLQETFDMLDGEIQRLQPIYRPEHLQGLYNLRDRMIRYIFDCTINATEEQVRPIVEYSPQTSPLGVDHFMAEIEKTKAFISQNNQGV